jgi:transcription termination factor NusB
MANRHLSRSIVLQTLFEWDFMQGGEWNDEKVEEALSRNLHEFGPGLEDDVFVFNLTKEVLKKKKVVDEIIEKAAPDWPLGVYFP